MSASLLTKKQKKWLDKQNFHSFAEDAYNWLISLKKSEMTFLILYKPFILHA